MPTKYPKYMPSTQPKYDEFIGLLEEASPIKTPCADRDYSEVLEFLKTVDKMDAMRLIYMSQRSAQTEHHQLVGDFILSQCGGPRKMWAF